MKVLITGTSKGIGRAAALKFISEGHLVIGLDIQEPTIPLGQHGIGRYIHYMADVANKHELPDIDDVDILINNAGVQNSGRDIDVNLKGVINCTEKYGLQPEIKSIINQASVSAHNGAEFGEYTASKGGVLAYTIWTAKQIAKYGATCNSVSFGGVTTNLNESIMTDADSWRKIMDMTPLKKWCSAEEAAEWIYFMTVINKSATGQDIIIDNGEFYNHEFVWK